VEFVDSTIVRLADPATRNAVFDQQSLEALLAAGYDTTSMSAGPPYEPVFDDFEVGMYAPRVASMEGARRSTVSRGRRAPRSSAR
jgi:hypothetical protein